MDQRKRRCCEQFFGCGVGGGRGVLHERVYVPAGEGRRAVDEDGGLLGERLDVQQLGAQLDGVDDAAVGTPVADVVPDLRRRDYVEAQY